MPDKKCSVSSADCPLVEEAADAKVKTLPSIPRILCASLIPSAVVAALVVISGGLVVYFLLRRESSPVYINLVIDTRGIPRCVSPLGHDSALPCMRNRKLVTGGQDAANDLGDGAFSLGPMTCRDDAYAESGGSDNCKGNPFALTEDRTGVTIPETGVYRVHSRVTFDDSVDYYVDAIIRIISANCATDPACLGSSELRQKRSHTWLTCFNHSRPRKGPKDSSQFSTCSIDGVRRFNRGDVVSLQMTQAFRSINPFHKLTHLLVHKL